MSPNKTGKCGEQHQIAASHPHTQPRAPLKILYLGPNSGTCAQRAEALRRLGHTVKATDIRQILPRCQVLDRWIFHTGCALMGPLLRSAVVSTIGTQERFDLAWVDGGALTPPSLIAELKKRSGTVLNYNVDDPYGPRDGMRWKNYLQCVGKYDLLVVVREPNIDEAKARGGRTVMRVHRSADEVAHAPREISPEDRQKWASDVVFAGTWMPERGPLLAKLANIGVPITIYGDRWNRAPEWPLLKRYWRGPGLNEPDHYAKAIQCSKIAIGLLSKGNRDQSTQRSFEIPHLGGLLCAERTAEHQSLYIEDQEAVFWDTPEECSRKCLELLDNPSRRSRIKHDGRLRCIRNGTTNEQVLSRIIDAAQNLSQQTTAAAPRALDQVPSR